MAIAAQTVEQVYKLAGGLENTLKSLLVYRSDSRNPSLNAKVDADLAALKVLVDAATGSAS